MSSPLQVQRVALERLKAELQHMQVEGAQVIEAAHAKVNGVAQNLSEATNRWQSERQRRSDALARCRNSGGPDAPPPSCWAEEQAVQEADRNLQKCRELQDQLASAVAQFRQPRDHFNYALERTIPQAIARLDQYIGDIDKYTPGG